MRRRRNEISRLTLDIRGRKACFPTNSLVSTEVEKPHVYDDM